MNWNKSEKTTQNKVKRGGNYERKVEQWKIK